MIIQFPVRRFTVHGNSMLPTLKPGQDVLVWCWFVNPQVGDLVVFKKDNKYMIKRVHKVYDRTLYGMSGDNPNESTDSRQFGWINKSKIIGKVVYSYPSK